MLVAVQMLRQAPDLALTATVQPTTVIGTAPSLPWPAAGSAGVAVDGLGVLGATNAQAVRPIASVAKVMTAYVLLKERPLAPGQPGPTITITARDVARYQQMIVEDQSVQPVSAGQQLTQLELLQGMLVPSANNYGEILAAWHAGSVEAFVQKMNAEARVLGMVNTTYVDISGYSDRTVSTLQDQLILAREAMKNPVFAQTVAMPSVRLPGIGVVNSTNMALGQEGIVGIKTGSTEVAGGNLMFAAQRNVNGKPVLLIGGALGQADRPAAFEVARRLSAATGQALQQAKVISAGQVVGTVSPEWGKPVDVVVAQDVNLLLWPGSTLEATLEFSPVEAPQAAGSEAGSLVLKLGDQEQRVPVVLAKKLSGPGLFWRLFRL